MKNICKNLGCLIASLGCLGSVVLSITCGVNVYTGERDTLLTVIYLIAGLLGTAVIASILLGISEILGLLYAICPDTAKKDATPVAENEYSAIEYEDPYEDEELAKEIEQD